MGVATRAFPSGTLRRRPAPIAPSADWMVAAVLILSLLGAWMLRQQALFATEVVSVAGITAALPVGSFPAPGNDDLGLITPAGVVVRVNAMEAAANGGQDPVMLSTGRAIEQGKALSLYRALGTETATVDGQPAAVLEYTYVNTEPGSFFSSRLEVMHGYEVLVSRDDQLYVVTLEAPEAQWREVQALWPRLLDSLQIGE